MTPEQPLGAAVVRTPADPAFDGQCRDTLRQEWEALHHHLSTTGPTWPALVEAWGLLDASRSGQWHSLALPLLVARRSVAILGAEGGDAALDRWRIWKDASRDVQAQRGLDGGTLYAVATHPVYAEEAGELSHPDVDKRVGLIGTLPSHFRDILTTSLALIDLVGGRCRDVVRVGLGTLVVLDLPAGSPPGTCISFTSRGAPGAVFLTLTAPILLAESLVHEAVHNVLYAATRLSPVTRGGRTLLKSPLRRDLRPLEGVVHQALVLDYLCEFYERLLRAPTVDPVARNIPQITQRLEKCRGDRDAALSAIQGVGDDLGPLGAAVIDELASLAP